MKNFNRTTAVILAALMLSSLMTACSDTTADDKKSDAETVSNVSAETEPETEPEDTEITNYTDDLGEMKFDSATFNIRTIENVNVHSYMDVAEDSADVYDSSLYQRNRKIEERFDIIIKETLAADNNDFRNIITSGDKTFDMGNVRCSDGLQYWKDNLIYDIDTVPNIDLTKPYWAKKLNDSISLGGHQYVAIGAYDINVMDLTYALLFNKEMTEDLGFASPYETVKNGNWTMDEMSVMMATALSDLDGDGKMGKSDRWGYLAHYKQVLPDFWISCGEMSILKDENDKPYFNADSERFAQVFDKTFDIIQGQNVWFKDFDPYYDVPKDNIEIFSEGRSIFMDVSFFDIKSMRDSDTDFGILPYPKYDESQSEYYSRVTYYWANIIPVTNTEHLEMTGAILESLNCESANLVVPAYYDISLKAKYSRDEESAAMLDLIFENRVVDLGDTIFCGEIRDGFMASMFRDNKRELASNAKRNKKVINMKIEKLRDWEA